MNGDLANEGRYLHRALFGSEAPEEVVERYVRAHDVLPAACAEGARNILDRIVSNRLDPEAIEYVLRLRKRNPVLTQKLQVLFYLVEVRSAYYARFVNERPGTVRALCGMFAGLLFSAGKFVKGSYLVRRYGLG